MGAKYNSCGRKEIIERIKKVVNEMEEARVETRCCCIDPNRPPQGKKVITTQCLDGAEGTPKVVSDPTKGKYTWIPPETDNRPSLDPTMSCYAAAMAGRETYGQWKGCRVESKMGPDYCEDPKFVPPQPDTPWSLEPGGTCRYPQYCKADCFDHSPDRDWARN